MIPWQQGGETGPDAALAEVTDRLLQRRTVLVTGYLDAAAAHRAAGLLMLLERGGPEPVDLRIGCPDADLAAADLLADVVDLLGAPVRALATGVVGGPAVGVYAVAAERLAHARCGFRLGVPPAEAVAGTGEQLAAAAQRYDQAVARLVDRIARAAGRPVTEVGEQVRAGRFLSAEQAREFGLVQRLVTADHGPSARV